MRVIGIKTLQKNPDKLIKTLSKNDYAMKSFQSGDLSFGQLSKSLGKSHHDTMSFLGFLGVPISDYDLEEDLKAINEMMD
jgi:predicted HTH domain antitoxin